MEQSTSEPIPITVIAGFLGAGKTTLLNHILHGDHGRKIAVIINDFGSINIDAELVTDVGDGMVSLANGCICCVIRTDLISAVLKLADRPDRPDHIVIESSGVADPASVERAFMVPEIWNSVRYEGVISVVDAELCLAIAEDPDHTTLAEQQIRGGDLLIVNKVDLVTIEHFKAVCAWITEIKPAAEIIRAHHCVVPVELLLGSQKGYRPTGSPVIIASNEEQGQVFESWSYESPHPIHLYLFQELLKNLPPSLIRAKGFLFTVDKAHQQLTLQFVGRRATIAVNGSWNEQEPKTRLVFIAKSETVNFQAIERALNSCQNKRRKNDSRKSNLIS